MTERKEKTCAKCGITSKRDPSLTFHRFPVATERNSLKARVWAKFCYPNDDWTTYQSVNILHKKQKMLCGKHFDFSSYLSTNSKKLNNFAIPTGAQNILAEVRQEMINSSPDTSNTCDDPGPTCSTPQSRNSMALTIECTPWSQNDKLAVSVMLQNHSDCGEFKLVSSMRRGVHHKHSAKDSSYGNESKELNLNRLPKVPQFSGKFRDWPTFKVKFISMIHSSKLDDINKLYYLISAVKGNALHMIQKLEFTAENYSIAWQILLNKYDNDRRRVNNLMSGLLDFPTMKKECSRDLRSLVDNVNTSLCALRSLGHPTEHWDTIVIHLMLRKLDSVTYREWENQCIELITPNLKQFLDFLSNKAYILEFNHKDDKQETRKKRKLKRENIISV